MYCLLSSGPHDLIQIRITWVFKHTSAFPYSSEIVIGNLIDHGAQVPVASKYLLWKGSFFFFSSAFFSLPSLYIY